MQILCLYDLGLLHGNTGNHEIALSSITNGEATPTYALSQPLGLQFPA